MPVLIRTTLAPRRRPLHVLTNTETEWIYDMVGWCRIYFSFIGFWFINMRFSIGLLGYVPHLKVHTQAHVSIYISIYIYTIYLLLYFYILTVLRAILLWYLFFRIIWTNKVNAEKQYVVFVLFSVVIVELNMNIEHTAKKNISARHLYIYFN